MTTEATTPRHYTAADIPAGALRSPYGLINEHGLRLIREFEGPPRLKARLCEGGRQELGPGVTFHLDGSPVLEGETCDEAYAEALFAHAIRTFCGVIDKHVHVETNSHQYAALVALAYNIGEENFAYSGPDRKGSSVLKRMNERQYHAAAEAFGMWVYATKGGHKQALRGLLRRHFAEACLFMGYDWEVACSDDAISLVRERPPNDIGTDRVLFKTKFTDVLTVAQRYPLPPLDELVLTTPAPSEPFKLERYEADVAKVTAPSPRAADEAAQQPANPARNPAAGAAPAIEKPVSNGPAPATPPVKIPAPQRAPEGSVLPSQKVDTKPPDPPVPIGQQTSAVDGAKRSEEWSSGTKAMWQSRRFYGLVLIMAGRLWMLKTGSNAFLGAVSDPLVMEFVGGFGVMIAGELIQSWGRAKAKKALH